LNEKGSGNANCRKTSIYYVLNKKVSPHVIHAFYTACFSTPSFEQIAHDEADTIRELGEAIHAIMEKTDEDSGPRRCGR